MHPYSSIQPFQCYSTFEYRHMAPNCKDAYHLHGWYTQLTNPT